MTYGEVRDMALQLIHQEEIAGTEIPGTYNNQQDYLDKIPGLINAAMMDIATTAMFIPESVMLSELTYEDKGRSRVYTMPYDMWQLRGSGILVPQPHGRGYTRFAQVKHIGKKQIILPHRLPEDSIVEYYRYPIRFPQNSVQVEEITIVQDGDDVVTTYELETQNVISILAASTNSGMTRLTQDIDYMYNRALNEIQFTFTPTPGQKVKFQMKVQAVSDDEELDNVIETHELIPYYVAAHIVMYDDAFLYASLYNEYESKKANLTTLITSEPDTVFDVYFPPSDYFFWG